MKRILICTIAVFMLASLMVLPAFAVEKYIFVRGDGTFMECNVEIPSSEYNIALFYRGDNIGYTLSPVRIDFKESKECSGTIPVYSVLHDVVVSANYSILSGDGFTFASIDIPGIVTIHEDFEYHLEPVAFSGASSMLNSVTACLTSSVRWCGMVISALVSGDLSPLLPLFAVAVSIAAFLMAPKIIKRFTWGA